MREKKGSGLSKQGVRFHYPLTGVAARRAGKGVRLIFPGDLKAVGFKYLARQTGPLSLVARYGVFRRQCLCN